MLVLRVFEKTCRWTEECVNQTYKHGGGSFAVYAALEREGWRCYSDQGNHEKKKNKKKNAISVYVSKTCDTF